MPSVRCLNDAGVQEFAGYLARLRSDATAPPPFALLEDPRFTRPTALGAAHVEHRDFANRREFADYVDARFRMAGIVGTADEPGLWEWLSLFYFDAVCPPDAAGRRQPGAANRHLVNSAFARRRHRHLLRGPYMLHRRYRGGPNGELDLLLAYPLHVHGVAATHLVERPRLLDSPGVLAAANRLYFDTATAGPKPGYADDSSGLRSFCRFLNNLPAAFDLAHLGADTVLALLPPQFEDWLAGSGDTVLRFRHGTPPQTPQPGEPWAGVLNDLLQDLRDRPLAAAQRRVRSDLFRTGVVAAYSARCAVSGLGLAHAVGDKTQYEVQAAHIVPVAQGGRDLIQNGLALTRTVHWAFDLGMVWFDDRLRLAVAEQALRDSRNRWLAQLRGRSLAMPANPQLAPSAEALQWHAAHVAGAGGPSSSVH